MVRYRRERHSENADAEKEYDRTKTEPGTKRADDPKKHPDHGGHYGRCDDCMSGAAAFFRGGYACAAAVRACGRDCGAVHGRICLWDSVSDGCGGFGQLCVHLPVL